MIQGLVEAICDRPGQTAARREARATEVVHSTMAFQPRDAVEMMLAGMVVTHFHLVSHVAHDAFRTRPEDPKPRATSGIVALGRAMVGFAKELRAARTRPMEEAMEAAAAPEPSVAANEQAATPGPTAPADRQETRAADRKRAEPTVSSRRGGTSPAAMMAVLSPPPKPSFGNSGPRQSVAAPQLEAARGMSFLADAATRAPLPGLPGAPVAPAFGGTFNRGGPTSSAMGAG